MAEYIEREALIDYLEKRLADRPPLFGWLCARIASIPSANVVEVVRCKDCQHHHWEQELCHGKTVHICSVLNAEVFKDFYCYHGKRKEQSNG